MKDFAEHFSENLESLENEEQETTAPNPAETSKRYFYENENRKDILNKVSHLIDYTNLVLFIQGANGTGKTSVAKQCAEIKNDNWRACYLSARNCTTENDFIETLVNDFQLKFNTDNQIDIAFICEQLEGLRHSGEVAVLIVNDIELLHPSLVPILATLISHSQEKSPYLRLLALGENLPDSVLDAIPREENQATLKYLPLLPFTLEETREYIDFRLSSLGLADHPLFDDEHVRQIHLNSMGVPKIINTLSDELLDQLSTSTLEVPQNKGKQRPKNFNNIAVLLVAGIVTLIVILAIPQSENQESDIALIPLTIPDENTVTTQPKIVDLEQQIRHEEKNNKPASIRENPLSEESEMASLTTNSTEQVDVLESLEETDGETILDEELTATPPLTSANQKSSNEEEPVIDNWLMAQQADHYTIQLIGTTKEGAANAFIEQHNITQHAKLIRTLRNNKDWYIVLHHTYPTNQEAKTARNSLSPELKAMKPWIRQFEGIQVLIDQP